MKRKIIRCSRIFITAASSLPLCSACRKVFSTYVNGVRVNEPFGDSVNWDLIPRGAIDTMELYPGSNPLYGLNSLGGAISMKTKTGFSAPKHQFEAYGGSWDWHSEELTSGWNNATFGCFIDLHHFAEQGWRNFSPAEANQVFSK